MIPIFRPVIVASPDGGVDIEEVAEKTPDRIMKLPGTYSKNIKHSLEYVLYNCPFQSPSKMAFLMLMLQKWLNFWDLTVN